MECRVTIGKRSIFVLAVFLAGFALTSCSGGNGFLFSSGSGATFPMGDAGGTITYPVPGNPGISVELVFPQGAVPDGTVISIRETNAYSFDPNVIDGLVFDFGPDGILFGHSVTLTLTYVPAALGGVSPDHLRIHKRAGSAWQELPTTLDPAAHTLTASLSGFSTHAGFSEITPPVTTAIPSGGTYATAQSVTLSCDDGTGTGCVGTYYTTDGSTPTASSSQYTAPIIIAADTVLKFFSVDNAANAETVKTENYFITTVPPTFTVGGTVSGLTSILILQNNGGDDLIVTSDGPFAFATPLQNSDPYLVTVLTQPPGQTCTVANGSGTISGTDVTTVAVTCADIPPSNTPPVNTTAANYINGGAASTTSLDFSLAISATDDVGVVAYLVQEGSPTPPSPGDPGWVAVTPTTAYSATVNHSYTSDTTAGTKTVYVFFKDGDSAVSSGVGDSITYSPIAPQGQLITFEEVAAQYLSNQYASRGVTFQFSGSVVPGQHNVPYVEWWSWGPAGNKAWLCNDKVSNSYITGVIHILLTTPSPDVRFVIYQNLDIVIQAFDPGGAQLPASVVTRVDRTDPIYGAIRDVTIQEGGGIKEIRLLASPGVVFVDALSY